MRELFDFEYPNVWDELKNTSLPIVLYGMGNGADKVLDEFEKRGIRAAGVMASDDFCRYQEFRGFTVKKQSDFEREFGLSSAEGDTDNLPGLVTGSNESHIARSRGGFIIALCFGSSLPDVMDHIYETAQKHPLLIPNVPVAGDTLTDDGFLAKYRGDIETAFSLLADDKSRTVFKGVLDFYYTGRPEYLKAIESDKSEAFENILRLKNESFLDLGAYRGDTVDEFLHYTDGYTDITAVEPNPKNYKKLREHIADINNASAINAGIADSNGVMRIGKKAGRMPTLGDKSGVEVPVMTVDSLGCQPSYIKVDIEGTESAMLRGARRTIGMYKPKLNLAAYHRSEDFFSLILQLHAINPDYRIYLRKHPYIPCWDLNIYAI